MAWVTRREHVRSYLRRVDDQCRLERLRVGRLQPLGGARHEVAVLSSEEAEGDATQVEDEDVLVHGVLVCLRGAQLGEAQPLEPSQEEQHQLVLTELLE